MRRPTTSGYKLHSHNPVRSLFGLLVAFLLLVAAGFGLYWVGYHASGKDAVTIRAEVAKLREQVSYLQQRNQTLIDKNAQLGRAGVIDREAIGRVQTMLNKMQDKLADLNEEVSFYRSIVSPSKLKPGLHLQHFQLNLGSGGDEFNYHLVLTQVQDKHNIVKGRVSVHIIGQSAGHKKMLSMAKLATTSLSFSFHYFQDLTGGFVLPKGFVPQRVEIKVTPFTRQVAGVTKTVTWDQAIKGEG